MKYSKNYLPVIHPTKGLMKCAGCIYTNNVNVITAWFKSGWNEFQSSSIKLTGKLLFVQIRQFVKNKGNVMQNWIWIAVRWLHITIQRKMT